jgi:ferrous iron transport protein A
MMPLALLSAGQSGEIIAIRAPKVPSCTGENARCDCRVEDLGLRVGSTVEMLNNASGPVLLKVGEARIAIDRGLAMKIMIKEVGR